MRKYNVYVMESKRGVYTCNWVLLGTATATSTYRALSLIAPISTKLEKRPATSRSKNNTFFEYDKCKYCVELIQEREGKHENIIN